MYALFFWKIKNQKSQKTLDKYTKICGAALKYMYFKGGNAMNYSQYVKDSLLKAIKEVAQDPKPYCLNPDKDFTRNRKLPFEEMLRLIIMMEGGSIKKELLSYFDYDLDTVTSSAFIQQRSKIKPEAFEQIFHSFNNACPTENLYKGYRLLSCEGSDLITGSNPKDIDHHFNYVKGIRTFNMTHFSGLYDILNRRFIDAVIQPGYKSNERGALVTMMSRLHCENPSIVIADRGYTSYNIYAFAQENNLKYVIRAKEKEVRLLLEERGLDFNCDFDYTMNLQLTHRQTKVIKSQPKVYKCIAKKSFKYFDENGFYPITFRVVRVPLGEGSYEYLFTNLPNDPFDSASLKEMYHLRWNIETTFRTLKYPVGLVNLHTKKAEHIEQEIFAKFILYNFCETITTHVLVLKKKKKHYYQLNFTLAITICKYFLRCGSTHSERTITST